MTVQEAIKKLADNCYLQLKETICTAAGQLIDSYANSQPQKVAILKCKHKKKCGFWRAFGYCIKQIGEECTFIKEEGAE